MTSEEIVERLSRLSYPSDLIRKQQPEFVFRRKLIHVCYRAVALDRHHELKFKNRIFDNTEFFIKNENHGAFCVSVRYRFENRVQHFYKYIPKNYISFIVSQVNDLFVINV